VSWRILDASKGVLTVVAKSFDIPSLTDDIQTEVMLDRVEVVGTLEFTTMQPAGEECEGELVKVIEGQLILGRRWRGGQQLVEEGDLVGEQVVGHRKFLVGNASTKNGSWDVLRRGSLAAWVVGMDGSDE
jgi:hypothetical protein